MFRICVGILALLVSIPTLQARETITIAAAADLVYCVPELNTAFGKQHPDVELTVTNGSSGMFFTQIRQGAPIDVYMSADMSYPRKLAEEGSADRKSLTLYAIGRIVLWTMDPDVNINVGMAVMRDAKVQHIALANPEHAPYGRAGKAAIEKAGFWKEIEPKVVYGENIVQAKQYAESGNAEIGILALSLVRAPTMAGKGRYWVIPEDMYPPLEQGAALTTFGKDKVGARQYIKFLRTPEARKIFEKYGFILPAAKSN